MSAAEASTLLGSLESPTYEQIAESFGYAVSYLKKDVSHQFWKYLGEQVSKTNFRVVLEVQ
jgi:hypothetical protein